MALLSHSIDKFWSIHMAVSIYVAINFALVIALRLSRADAIRIRILGGIQSAVNLSFAIGIARVGLSVSIGEKAVLMDEIVIFILGMLAVMAFFATINIAGARQSGSIKRPPGGWLLKLADCACRKSTLDLITQMVADMHVEYFQALNEGRPIKAEWIKGLHFYSIARALTIDRLIAAGFNYVLGAISRK